MSLQTKLAEPPKKFKFNHLFEWSLKDNAYYTGVKALNKKDKEAFYQAFLKEAKIGIEIECEIQEDSDERPCDDCDRCNMWCESPREMVCSNCDYLDTQDCQHINGNDICAHFGEDLCAICSDHGYSESFCDGCERVSDSAPLEEIAETLHCDSDKEEDGYDELPDRDFLYVYKDGSVNCEVVTAPLRLRRISDILKKAINTLNDHDADFSPNCGAGGHQTFCMETDIPKIVVLNAIQLARYYASVLVKIGCYQGTSGRGTYRVLNGNIWETNHIQDYNLNEENKEKYQFVHVKNINDKTLIEFRYPDSIVNINKALLTAIVNTSLVGLAIKISERGILRFSQKHWEKVKENIKAIFDNEEFEESDYDFNLFKEFKHNIIQIAKDLGFDIEANLHAIFKEGLKAKVGEIKCVA